MRLRLRLILVLMLLPLAGCGFHPLYAKRDKGDVAATLSQVNIPSIPERNGQILRNQLIDRLYGEGRPERPLYDLTVQLRTVQADLGVRTDATSARTRIELEANYRLIRRVDGATVLTSVARSTVSYNRFEAQYATLTARENATRRALDEVGEQIVNRLALYADHPDTPTANP